MIHHGLKQKTTDNRDIKVGSLITIPKLSELPTDYRVGYPMIQNQGDSDFCAGAASCEISELQEGVELGYEWVFAVAKSLEGGDVNEFGVELRNVCRAHVKYGAIKRSDSPYSLEDKDISFLRRIENWPQPLFDKALEHRKGSFFSVDGPYDAFDNIKATMWRFRDEKCAVIFGVVWSWPIDQAIIESFEDQGTGHAMAIVGWENIDGKDYLIVQNSAGIEAGYGGEHRMSRKVINHFADKFGLYMFHDLKVEDARSFIDNGVTLDTNWIVGLWKIWFNLLREIYARIVVAR